LQDGKVPLFYFEGFETNAKGGDDSKIPLYFQKKQLLQDWKKENPKKEGGLPEVQVTELFSVLSKMVEPSAIENDGDLGKLVFIPPARSAAKATECAKKGGEESPFTMGERILVL